ncbi:hypothetical protein [Oxynema aestuarii]|uniref:Uncharacterized protein n=1 Tax=Oxynema aestuarii AP17 TaxID=2064643 RepID=A0A6H1U2Z3_9CYAN|nr:hypothetical protein [Oxynema aestuarii]QIZ72403.1 hypothetical protein HCG48_18930 [Oxynema aestuarii AP17]
MQHTEFYGSRAIAAPNFSNFRNSRPFHPVRAIDGMFCRDRPSPDRSPEDSP